MNKFLRALAAVGSVAAATAATTVPAGAVVTSGPQYYLSLGDSLAQGVQPNAAGISLETDQGYVDDIENAELVTNPSLQDIKLGCPGETTHSYLRGGVCATPYGTQNEAAVKFLKKYGSRTSFVTIDIGANDIDGCVVGGVPNFSCVAAGVQQTKHDLPLILAHLQAADPGVKIYGMDYYDPFLSAYLLGSAGQQLATETVAATVGFNQVLNGIYAAYKVPVADIATTPFATTDTTFTSGFTIGGNPVPNNVGELCSLTWNCTPAPQGPNIHANAAGYSAIANTFLGLINS